MQPRIIEMEPLALVGMSFFGDPFRLSAGWTQENEIGQLWSRFIAFLEQCSNTPAGASTDKTYEVHIYHPETRRTGEFEVFVGIEVPTLQEIPIELTAKLLPRGTFALFTLRGEQIASDWPIQAVTEWLPAAGYQMVETFSIQRHDERFKGMNQLSGSELDVLLPVRPQQSG